MRLWSLHPCYLDSQGLVALWREGLLAQAVLAGETRGYRHHPQLARFLQSPAPGDAIAAYLRWVHGEACLRGYRFDAGKIRKGAAVEPMEISRGQLDYEWSHLRDKLQGRSPAWLDRILPLESPLPHPLFRLVEGGIASWEVVAAKRGPGPAG